MLGAEIYILSLIRPFSQLCPTTSVQRSTYPTSAELVASRYIWHLPTTHQLAEFKVEFRRRMWAMSQPRLRDTNVSLFFVILLCSSPLAFCQNDSISNPGDQPVGWREGSDSRGTWDIISNCMATIIACTWTVQHFNVPGPRASDSPWSRRWRSVKWMIITILFPEFMVLHAMFELVMAVNALQLMKAKEKKSVEYPWWLPLRQIPSNLFTGTCSLGRKLRRARFLFCHGRNKKDTEAQVTEDNNKKPDAEGFEEARIWTLSHCFFAQYGRNTL